MRPLGRSESAPTLLDMLPVLSNLRADVETRYPIRLLEMFGSVARGEAGPDSDVDILVEGLPGLSLFKLWYVQEAIEEAVGRPVDLVFADVLKSPMRERIASELVLL